MNNFKKKEKKLVVTLMSVYKKLLNLIYSVSVLNSDNNHMIVGKFIKDPSHVSIYFAATREILT